MPGNLACLSHLPIKLIDRTVHQLSRHLSPDVHKNGGLNFCLQYIRHAPLPPRIYQVPNTRKFQARYILVYALSGRIHVSGFQVA